MPGFQVYSRDINGVRHEERYTTNETLAKELSADLPKDPEIEDAWYVMVSAI